MLVKVLYIVMDDNKQQLSVIKKVGQNDCVSREVFEERVREIAKCRKDIIYFAEKYFRIVNLDTGLGLIKMYPKQKDLLRFFANEKRCIALASRQSGKTTTYTIYALWTLIFQPEKRIMLLANKADTSLEILSRIKLGYEYLPTWLKPGIVVLNKGEIIFSNRSAIKGFATASDSARGYSAAIVIMDEAAFVPNNIASRVFESIYPVISSSKNSQFIMVSTPNGADPNNLYYNIWQQANQKVKDKNTEGWKAFRFDWWDVPGRDKQWKANTIASIGERRFAQEFGNEFISSGNTHKLVPDDKLEQFRMKLADLRAKNETGMKQRISSAADDRVYEFTVWKAFDKSRTYMASGDTAEGVGGDASVLYIWDVTDLSHISMCAKYDANDVSLVEFAYVCRKILALYGDPPLFAERNGVSAGMLESLRVTYGYQNIATEGKDGDAGIYSHVTIKGRANLWAREMLTTDGFGFEIPDKDLVDEMQTFVKKDTKGHFTVFQAAPGAHDDHMMSFVWGCWALSEEVIQKYFNITGVFKNSFGQQQPAKLAPLSPYSADALNALEKDKAYLDYVSFRQQAVNRYAELMQQQQREDRNDVFKYKSDDYFEDDWSGADWNTGNNDITMPNETVPVYFI